VFNPQPYPVDLLGWRLGDTNNPLQHTIATSVVVPSTGFAVLGRSADTLTNGGVAVDYAWGGLPGLGNSGDAVFLTAADGTLIDAVDYAQAGFPDPSGASIILDPGSLDATANDLPLAWCAAPLPWPGSAGDLGSPGEPNPPCPVPL
jgi:hypothetical protein